MGLIAAKPLSTPSSHNKVSVIDREVKRSEESIISLINLPDNIDILIYFLLNIVYSNILTVKLIFATVYIIKKYSFHLNLNLFR